MIPRIIRQEPDHLVAASLVVKLAEGFLVASAQDDRLPETAETLAVEPFKIQQQLLVDVDQSGKVVSPLDVADHPV